MRDIDELRRAAMGILEKEAGGQNAAATRAGMSYPQWRNLRAGAPDSKTGKPRGMRKETARRIEEAFGKPLGWLDQDHETPSSAPSHIPAFDVNVTPVPTGTREHRVPVISYVQAGDWSDAADPHAMGTAWEWTTTDIDVSRSAFAVDVRGRSMEPRFAEGDRLIVDPGVAPTPGDFVIAKNGHEEATFKRYRVRGIDAEGREIVELVPLNDDYPTIRSDITPLRVVGVVVEHRQRLRKRG